MSEITWLHKVTAFLYAKANVGEHYCLALPPDIWQEVAIEFGKTQVREGLVGDPPFSFRIYGFPVVSSDLVPAGRMALCNVHLLKDGFLGLGNPFFEEKVKMGII
jgi:hypothetical protein